MNNISVSLPAETVEALSTEAELRDFDSRSAYIRHILENRGKLDSIDSTEVEILEAVAERVEKQHHENISDLEDRLRNFEQGLERARRDAEEAGEYHRKIKEFEDSVYEAKERAASIKETLSKTTRQVSTQQHEIRSNEEDIESLRSRFLTLQSQMDEIQKDPEADLDQSG